MIQQLIEAYKNKIALNPFKLSGLLYPLQDNSFGSYIENRSGIPQQKIYKNLVGKFPFVCITKARCIM